MECLKRKKNKVCFLNNILTYFTDKPCIDISMMSSEVFRINLLLRGLFCSNLLLQIFEFLSLDIGVCHLFNFGFADVFLLQALDLKSFKMNQ